MNFSGKVVLLTGAVGGIGSCTARRFVNEGASVALLDQDESGLEMLRRELGISASAFPCDVSQEQSMAGAVQSVAECYGRIDIGVLNAGVSGKRVPLEKTDTETFDRIIGVNARGVFLGLKHLFAVMQPRGGGSIVVTGSTESLRGNVGLAPYVASKHAVLGLVRTAALEWAKHHIRVNSVNPGPVDTEMMRAVERNMIAAGATDVREKNTAKIPMQRYASPEEVASCIAFLASEESRYTTGTTLLLDGGILAGKLE
jgi:NAD(P)-dependent dehydrogenase (short-subunit alcohol dehydrogenase family)